MNFSKVNWKLNDGERWLELDHELAVAMHLDQETIKALSSGVPADFAPFSSFENNGTSIVLQPLNEYYNISIEHGTAYIVFGTDGEGNPFFINKVDNNSIGLFDFDGGCIISANKNMGDFLDSITAYRHFIDSIIHKYGADAFIDMRYKEEDVKVLENNLLEIDSAILKSTTFWALQLKELLA